MSLSGNSPVNPRPVGDLFSPFFRVAFKALTKETGVVQETDGIETFQTTSLAGTATSLNSDDTDQFEIDSRLLTKVAASLTLESKAGSPFKFTLELTPPYDDAIRILNNKLVSFGTLVKVQWGYTSANGLNNILSDIHVFRNQFPKAEFGNDITITLSGFDMVADVAMRNTTKKPWDRTLYPTDMSIVQALVQKVGYKIDVTSLAPTHSFLVKDPDSPDSIEQSMNDWAFIRKLCRDHSVSFIARGTTFKVITLFEAVKPQVAYNLLWRLKPKTDIDIPVYSVNGNLEPFLFQPPEARGILSVKFNPNTGEAEVDKVRAADLAQTNLGPEQTSDTEAGDAGDIARSLSSDEDEDGEVVFDDEAGASIIPRPKPSTDDYGTVVSEPKDGVNSGNRIKSQAREAQGFSHPKVGVSCPGIPDMFPGLIVKLFGTSKLFDSPYQVLTVKHVITTSGYDMELELFRHTVKTDVGTVPRSPAQDPPEGTPEAEPEDPDFPEDE